MDDEFDYDDDGMFASEDMDLDGMDDHDDGSSAGTAESDDESDEGDQGDWHPLTALFMGGEPDEYRNFLYHTPSSDPTAAAYWCNPDGERKTLSSAMLEAYSYETIHSTTIRRMLHQEGADMMVDFGMANVNALQMAIGGGKLAMICDYRLFIDASCDQYEDDGCPLLMQACRSYDLATVRLLLSVPGIHVNAVGPNGSTALHEADRAPFITLLALHPGVEVNVLDGEGRHPMHRSLGRRFSTAGSQHAINPLLARADFMVNLQDYHQQTALMIAVQDENIDAVTQLLARPDIDITVQDGNGRTAFALANHGGLNADEFMRTWKPKTLGRRCHQFK